MIPLTFPSTKQALNVLCLGAHCDDIEIGCGGTILRMLKDNPETKVSWIVFSGNELRVSEFSASAQSFLGVGKGRVSTAHDFPDGYFPHALKDIKDCFEKMKQELTPDLIFTHFRNDLHQDHRVISELTRNTFRNHLILEYEIPKFDGDFGSPNFFVQLSEDVCRQKISIIMDNYASQAHRGWFTEDTFQAVLRIRGVEANSPTRFAEGFYAWKMVS